MENLFYVYKLDDIENRKLFIFDTPQLDKRQIFTVPYEYKGTLEECTSFIFENGTEEDYIQILDYVDNVLKENKKDFEKADDGKLKWSLLPYNELEQVVKVLTEGAKKYSPDNWKKCDDVARYKDALLRHITAYMKGDKVDKEFGCSHLAHAMCNCLFLMWFDNNK